MPSNGKKVRVLFADSALDLSSGELVRNGRRIRLQTQPFLVLRLLLERAGEVVEREELQRLLWPNQSFGDFDHGLNKAIARLRDALEDSKTSSRLIETLSRRGYRFAEGVTWIDDSPSDAHLVRPLRNWVVIRYWLAVGLVLSAVVAAAGWLTRDFTARWFPSKPNIQSIAVLPLENLTNDPAQDYVANGMTDELITDLSRVRSLRVISRVSTRGFRGSRLSVPEIAAKLHVDAVIEGSVIQSSHRVRVSIRLVAANPEKQIWAESYEGGLSDVLTVQNRIAIDAVGQIQTRVAPEERAALTVNNHLNPEAHDEYLRALYFLDQETGQEHKAIPHLQHAIQLEPGFAEAYAALGEAWAMEGVWGDKSNREVAPKALEFSRKAVSLDPNSSEAFASLGHSLMQSRRWNEGEVALRHAIELNPNNVYAREYLAILLAQKGRLEESVPMIREIAVENPVALDIQNIYANVLYRARRYDEAIVICRTIIELEPNHLATYSTYANALAEVGRFREAREAFKRGKFLDAGVEAWLDAKAGDLAQARRLLRANPNLVNVHTAVARYLVGDKEAGLAELDYLANEKWADKTYHLRDDPTFDPMRSDPRFFEIEKKSGVLDN